MKLIPLLLLAFSSVSLANDGVCSIQYDRHDRAKIYSRNFVVGKNNVWPNSTVPYLISPNFSEKDVKGIRGAMVAIEKRSCVKFVPYTTQRNYVNVVAVKAGCSANVGFNANRKKTNVYLGKNTFCTGHRAASHELLHALGFSHEHTRPDRDEYIKVHFDLIGYGNPRNWFRAAAVNEYPLPPICNVKKKNLDNCYSGVRHNTLGVEYDYASVMHYDLYAGSKNYKPVIEPLKKVPKGVAIGYEQQVSLRDFQKLNILFSCDGKFAPKPTPKPCSDTFGNCKIFKIFCNSSPAFANGCKKTCGKCEVTKPPKPCVDAYVKECPYNKNSCGKSNFVTSICPRTCGTC